MVTRANQKEVLKVLKDYASILRDETETEVSFKPHISTFVPEAPPQPSESGIKRKRAFSEDGEEDLSTPKASKWSEMFGPSYGRVMQLKTKKKDKLQLEIEDYMEEEVIGESEDPLIWWKENASRFPTLSLLAKKYFGTPATSVPCERLFSIAGEVISKKRNRLSVGQAEMYVFMKAYYNLED